MVQQYAVIMSVLIDGINFNNVDGMMNWKILVFKCRISPCSRARCKEYPGKVLKEKLS
jgi:hypothetical protein